MSEQPVTQTQESGPGGGGMAAGLEAVMYRALSSASSMKAFQDQVAAFLDSWGFNSFSYQLVGADHKRLTPPKSVMTTLPADLLAAYREADFHLWDVALDYAFHNKRDVFYSDLQAELKAGPHETTARQVNQEIFQLYRSFGYHDFYLIPAGRGGTSALFSVADRDSDPTTLMAKVARSNYGETDIQ